VCHDVNVRTISKRDEAWGWEKMMEDVEVLTTEEAAALLRVSSKAVLALARDGSLPGTKVGRAWSFLRTDLMAYVHGGSPEGQAGASAS
jgi:excisionase family DNA binding protein